MEKTKEETQEAARILVKAAFVRCEELDAEWCEALFWQVLVVYVQEAVETSKVRHNQKVQANTQ